MKEPEDIDREQWDFENPEFEDRLYGPEEDTSGRRLRLRSAVSYEYARESATLLKLLHGWLRREKEESGINRDPKNPELDLEYEIQKFESKFGPGAVSFRDAAEYLTKDIPWLKLTRGQRDDLISGALNHRHDSYCARGEREYFMSSWAIRPALEVEGGASVRTQEELLLDDLNGATGVEVIAFRIDWGSSISDLVEDFSDWVYHQGRLRGLKQGGFRGVGLNTLLAQLKNLGKARIGHCYDLKELIEPEDDEWLRESSGVSPSDIDEVSKEISEARSGFRKVFRQLFPEDVEPSDPLIFQTFKKSKESSQKRQLRVPSTS